MYAPAQSTDLNIANITEGSNGRYQAGSDNIVNVRLLEYKRILENRVFKATILNQTYYNI